eukprot:EG_transcript_15767
MEFKTFSFTAVAAVSIGVAVGLLTSSVTNMYVASAHTQAIPTVRVPIPSYIKNAAPVGLVAHAAQEDVHVESRIPSSNNLAIAALASASAIMGAVVLALRRRGTNAYEAILDDPEVVLAGAGRAMGAAIVGAAVASSANAAALTFDELQSLSYLEVKGSGVAGQCPFIADGASGKLNLKGGKYEINNMCLEPSSFQVKLPPTAKQPVPGFEKTKLLTRMTYTLDPISADLNVGSDGSWTIQEKDGMDYAATTVQLGGGERVPFLFTVKNLQAKGDGGQFLGKFDVPSYRGATFQDPKGRGGATGYDTAVALPASGDDAQYTKENNKSTESGVGTIAFKVAKVNAETGEIAGVFESIQPSDTDLGAKLPKDIKTSGVWYAQISPSA